MLFLQLFILFFQSDEVEVEAEVVRKINEVVRSGHSDKALYQLLSDPVMRLQDFLFAFGAPLYLSELGYIRQTLKSDLTKTSIIKTVKFLAYAVQINCAVKEGSVTSFWSLISDPKTKLVSHLNDCVSSLVF